MCLFVYAFGMYFTQVPYLPTTQSQYPVPLTTSTMCVRNDSLFGGIVEVRRYIMPYYSYTRVAIFILATPHTHTHTHNSFMVYYIYYYILLFR